jgi:hypothetical protein
MSPLSSPVLFVLAVIGAGLAAAVGHELTHLLVARLGGRRAWIVWRELNCYHELPLAGPTALDYAVGVAPFAVGSLAAVGWLLAGLDVTMPLLVAWGVYTLNGIPNDFRLTPGPAPDPY